MNDLKKFDKIIPIGRQEFAYQCENVSTICTITGHPPGNRGSLPYPNAEKEGLKDYKLEIVKFTSNSLTVNLTKRYWNGEAKLYQTTMSFAQLVNQIFHNIECNEFGTEISKMNE